MGDVIFESILKVLNLIYKYFYHSFKTLFPFKPALALPSYTTLAFSLPFATLRT